ncbi:MAG: hypothetical protein K2X51_18070 [Burkholderiales bacterium]|nr:hypothetical protein [Burkholderiales bacterium]
MYLVAIGWLYVALMMSVAEATHAQGTLLGAIVTFFLYGLGPVALVLYLMATPQRRKAIRAREAAEAASAGGSAVHAVTSVGASTPPDAGGEPPADPVAPVRKEP